MLNNQINIVLVGILRMVEINTHLTFTINICSKFESNLEENNLLFVQFIFNLADYIIDRIDRILCLVDE